jgi:hypothetical protein
VKVVLLSGDYYEGDVLFFNKGRFDFKGFKTTVEDLLNQ